jgi:hypothetical protein
MAVLMLLEVPGGTLGQYDRANELMGISGEDDAPEGLVSHVAAVTEDGIVIADVWESEAALETFFEERAGTALAEAGLPEAQPRIAQVHNHIPQGAGTDSGVLVYIEIDQLSPDQYDQMIDRRDGCPLGRREPSCGLAHSGRDGGRRVPGRRRLGVPAGVRRLRGEPGRNRGRVGRDGADRAALRQGSQHDEGRLRVGRFGRGPYSRLV